MKKIASLMLASICLLAFVHTSEASAPRWGWSAIEHPSGTARLDGRHNNIQRFAKLAGPVTEDVSVVSVNLDPKTTKVPGVLANLWPKLKDALAAMRNALSNDPTLKASLEVRGIHSDRVLGIGQGPNGQVVAFVSNNA